MIVSLGCSCQEKESPTLGGLGVTLSDAIANFGADISNLFSSGVSDIGAGNYSQALDDSVNYAGNAANDLVDGFGGLASGIGEISPVWWIAGAGVLFLLMYRPGHRGKKRAALKEAKQSSPRVYQRVSRAAKSAVESF